MCLSDYLTLARRPPSRHRNVACRMRPTPRSKAATHKPGRHTQQAGRQPASHAGFHYFFLSLPRRTLSSSRVKPRPARFLLLYFTVCTGGTNRQYRWCTGWCEQRRRMGRGRTGMHVGGTSNKRGAVRRLVGSSKRSQTYVVPAPSGSGNIDSIHSSSGQQSCAPGQPPRGAADRRLGAGPRPQPCQRELQAGRKAGRHNRSRATISMPPLLGTPCCQ